MTPSFRLAVVPAILILIALSIMALGPPDRAPAVVLRRDDLSAWCQRRFGSGGAAFIRGHWNCSHEISGFFVVTPMESRRFCDDLPFEADMVTADDDSIRCD